MSIIVHATNSYLFSEESSIADTALDEIDIKPNFDEDKIDMFNEDEQEEDEYKLGDDLIFKPEYSKF